MSSLASVEVAHSPDDLARLIDRELADIASQLPDHVMTSPLGVGTPHELYRISEVGSLHAMYLGYLTGPHKLGSLFNCDAPRDRYAGIRIVAQDSQDRAAYWQDFALDYWHRPQVITPSTAENITDALPGFPSLSFVVQSLHHAYMEHTLQQPNVISLTRRARQRAVTPLTSTLDT